MSAAAGGGMPRARRPLSAWRRSALLDDGEPGRQLAGAQEERHLGCLLRSEVSRNHSAAALDRRSDHRCRQNLAIEDDGDGPSHVRLRDRAQSAGPVTAELEVENWLLGRWIERRVGRDDVAARYKGLRHDEMGRADRVKEYLGARRRLSRVSLLGGHRGVDEPELEPAASRGKLDPWLDTGGCPQRRQPDHHPSGPFALYRRSRAGLIEAPLDDPDRLRHGV